MTGSRCSRICCRTIRATRPATNITGAHGTPAVRKAQLGTTTRLKLNAMRNDAIYRLAGMASFSLNRLDESRTFFEEALKMNPPTAIPSAISASSIRRAQLEPRTGRFTAPCRVRRMIGRLQGELPGSRRTLPVCPQAHRRQARQIQEAQALRDQSILNAAAATRNAASK